MRSRPHHYTWYSPIKNDGLCIRRYLAAHLKDA
jgi:hypothetical protein